jgi:hypothetical protein
LIKSRGAPPPRAALVLARADNHGRIPLGTVFKGPIPPGRRPSGPETEHGATAPVKDRGRVEGRPRARTFARGEVVPDIRQSQVEALSERRRRWLLTLSEVAWRFDEVERFRADPPNEAGSSREPLGRTARAARARRLFVPQPRGGVCRHAPTKPPHAWGLRHHSSSRYSSATRLL